MSDLKRPLITCSRRQDDTYEAAARGVDRPLFERAETRDLALTKLAHRLALEIQADGRLLRSMSDEVSRLRGWSFDGLSFALGVLTCAGLALLTWMLQ